MKELNILDFGAISGKDSTAAVQKAIDAACASDNAAKVIVPSGTYIIGTIDLKSVRLFLERGAVLLASPHIGDYRIIRNDHNEMHKVNPVLFSEEGKGIFIEGEGTIDLNARAFFSDKPRIPDYGTEFSEDQLGECTRHFDDRSTQPIFFHNCSNITITGITVKDAPCWTMSFHNCSDIRIENITIDNDLTIPNNDGMHFCGSRNIFIHGCRITAGDDCIALSGITNWDRPTEDVTVSDCIMESCSKAISVGYASSIIRNVTISNCVIRRSQRGIAIMSCAGEGMVENVTFSNLVIDTHVHAGDWWGNGEPICLMAVPHTSSGDIRPFPEPSRKWDVNIRNIVFRGIICHGENVIAMVGMKQNIEDIILDDIVFNAIPSRNRYLKGDRVIDLAPYPKNAEVQGDNTAIYLEEVRGAVLGNMILKNEKGEPMDVERHNA